MRRYLRMIRYSTGDICCPNPSMGIARANNKNEKGQNNSLFTTSVLRTTQHERERPTATSNPSSSSTYLRRPMLLHSSMSPFAFSLTLLLQIFLLFSDEEVFG